MRPIPRDRSPDVTLALIRDPYDFIAKRCRRNGSDVFRTRLLLQPAICMSGPEAAELFYDDSRFIREGAAPDLLKKTLFGLGGVQGLDGRPHRHRKQMFMSLMTPPRIRELADLSGHWWRVYARRWQRLSQLVLYHEVCEILTRAVCAWSGVPLPEEDVRRRSRELVMLFDFAGDFGVNHLRARHARRQSEEWAAELIDDLRGDRREAPEDSALAVIAAFRDLDGKLLERDVAAVELLNVLRPTVAVAVFVVFAAHALHHHPDWRARLASGDDRDTELFVQEVRRFYPFFPAVVARVRRDFEWNGYQFPRGTRTLLDLYGTNHDPRTWDAPDAFRPERFAHWDQSPYDFIPQGGGNHYQQHRCPGEWITIELMKVAGRFLAGSMTYDVPAQDLRMVRSHLPAMPRTGFIIANVRPTPQPRRRRRAAPAQPSA